MTRDNFLDIMGDIDRELIGDALNVKPKRRKIPGFFTGLAACAAVFAAVFVMVFVRNFAGIITSSDPNQNDSSVSLGNSFSPLEFRRGWDPEKLDYKEISDFYEIGDNLRITAAEVDGIKAELLLKNIKKEPGIELINELTGYEYTEYFGCEEIALYIRDNEGNRFIASNVTPHSFNNMKLIHSACLFDGCTRIYKTNSEYVIMQFSDHNYEKNSLIAGFYGFEKNRPVLRDENGIFECSGWRVSVFGDGRIGGWRYGYQASKGFEYNGDNKFYDPFYGYQMIWDKTAKIIYPDTFPEQMVPFYEEFKFINITGWDPEKLQFNFDPKPGESAVIAYESADGITASLILHNVIKRPGERHYLYSDDKYLDMWAADEIYLYLTNSKDAKNRRILCRIQAPISSGSAAFLPNSCLLDNPVRIVETLDGGYDVLLNINEKDGEPYGIFINYDFDLLTKNSPRDENGIYLYGFYNDEFYIDSDDLTNMVKIPGFSALDGGSRVVKLDSELYEIH